MKTKITQDEYIQVENQARVAKMFLENDDFQFIREYITSAITSIEQSILNNTVHDVTERVTITERTQKDFFTPKEEQIAELCGQYKWIKKFLSDIEYFSSSKKLLEEAIEKKDVVVEGQNGKDIN